MDRGERRALAFIKEFVADGRVPTIPSAVVVQAWRSGRQARMSRLIRHCRIEELTETRARRAGELCGRTTTSDVVDAVVVESAGRRGDVVLTSDPDDLRRLASRMRGVVVRPVSAL